MSSTICSQPNETLVLQMKGKPHVIFKTASQEAMQQHEEGLKLQMQRPCQRGLSTSTHNKNNLQSLATELWSRKSNENSGRELI